jgi:hypothetical protein
MYHIKNLRNGLCHVLFRETFHKSSSYIFVSNYDTASDETMTFLILKNSDKV